MFLVKLEADTVTWYEQVYISVFMWLLLDIRIAILPIKKYKANDFKIIKELLHVTL